MSQPPVPALPSRPIRCSLEIPGDPRHIRQIVTGFYELAAEARVDLRVRPAPPWLTAGTLALGATIEGRRVVYECTDGWNIPAELLAVVDDVDVYFKRRFDARRRRHLPGDLDLRPLGLTYDVVSRRNAWYHGRRPLHPRRLITARLRQLSAVGAALGIRDARRHTIEDFERLPATGSSPTVLFMTRAWPADVERQDAETVADRWAVNEGRAALVRFARRELGERFVGGFLPDAYAQRHYPDCLLPSLRAASQHSFLRRLRECDDICVATTGLWGSTGSKMAEYVAASKAIVSEPVQDVIPGGFSAGVNYLQFCSPEEFLSAVELLLGDRRRRLAMMEANHAHYLRWVRPSALVMRTLEAVLEGPNHGASPASPKRARDRR